ncbi:Glycerol-3-phosphate acyltransferase 9 [Dictyocoela muelleri]|nr:Glycerol-3-phosphate acyltransferase 9 [Dictyocoela muelleri]
MRKKKMTVHGKKEMKKEKKKEKMKEKNEMIKRRASLITIQEPDKKVHTILDDMMHYAALSLRSFHSDEFSRCFEPMLPRMLVDSGCLYIVSLFTRYIVLLPCRIVIILSVIPLFIMAILKGSINNDEQLISSAFLFMINVLSFCFCLRVKHKGLKRRLNMPCVFVANHTSFLDFIVLSSHKFCHAGVAEDHGGIFGWIYNGILKANGSIAFKRSEKTDKELVKEKIKEHVNKQKVPLLIFPEGTCVNNKYSVMYQKGAFDLGVPVCPVAIRYSKRIIDPYWNRRRFGFIRMILYYLTRWFVEVEVTWLDPTEIRPNEEPEDFARRVKSSISRTAHLINTQWNGYLKSNIMVKDRMILKDAFTNTYKFIIETREKEKNWRLGYLERIKSNDPAISLYSKSGMFSKSRMGPIDKINVKKKINSSYPWAREYDNVKYFSKFGYQTFINILLNEYFYIKKYHSHEYEECNNIYELFTADDEDDVVTCKCN